MRCSTASDAVSTDSTLELAELLLEYSVRVQAGDLVLISGPPSAKPLLEVLFRYAMDRGARPVIRISSHLSVDAVLNSAGDDPRRYVNPLSIPDGASIDCSIGIRADEPPRGREPSGAGAADPMPAVPSVDRHSRQQTDFLRRAADGHVRWAVAFYPTADTASDAGCTLAEFQQLVYRACMLKEDEPARSWERLHQQQLSMCRRLEQGARLKITAPNGTDLTLEVSGRHWISCNGRLNLPDGEVFTAPHENSASGVFAASFPIRHDDHVIAGARLEFSRGQVVAATAESGQEYLLDLLNRDTGARRLGEVGIGTNPHMTRGTGFSLLDEKIFGTCHVGIGACYPETGGANVSSVHRDFIVDLRNGGELLIDQQQVVGNSGDE